MAEKPRGLKELVVQVKRAVGGLSTTSQPNKKESGYSRLVTALVPPTRPSIYFLFFSSELSPADER